MTLEAQERTDELGELLLEHLQSQDDLDEAAAWLSKQDGVVSVATGPEAVRFRVRGGRGHWVFVRTLGSVGSLGAPTAAIPGRPPAASLPVVQGTTGGQEKRALLVSAFRWQWELAGEDDGMDEVGRALNARDYRDVTIMLEALDPGDTTRTTGGVGLEAFTTWDDYDFVYILTHGGAVCGLGAAANRCTSALMAPWTGKYVENKRVEAREASADELADTLDLMRVSSARGVETASVQVVGPKARVPDVKRGAGDQTKSEDYPLTERDKPEKERRIHTYTGPFVLLTPVFFNGIYKRGVSDAVVLLSACSSGYTASLAAAIKGVNTAVIGWRKTMTLRTAAAAGTLIAQTLVEVDEQEEDDSGMTVGQTIAQIRARLDELRASPPDRESCNDPPTSDVRARCAMSEYASVLTVINDVLADPVTGASLVVFGDSTLRAREIVYLVDETGAELSEGGVLPVIGAPGDGKADSVDLIFRVDGLALEDDPTSVDLKVVFDGREIDVEKGLEEEVAEGVWELEYRLPLRRDHRTGERVTVEAIAELPEGGDSRWIYEDIRLVGYYWTATVSGGPYAGTYSGSDARAIIWDDRLVQINLFSDPGARPYLTIMMRGNEREGAFALGTGQLTRHQAVEVLFSPDQNVSDAVNRGLGVGFGSDAYGTADPRFPPPATVEILEISDELVTGAVFGEFTRSTDPETGAVGALPELPRATVRIDFRAKALRR